jgi:DNA-binding XRE family transcriptional regulator
VTKTIDKRQPGSRLVVIKLPREMPGGKTTSSHPLIWLMREKLGEDRKNSDLARHLDVRPQSLYKWERLCKADRNFPLPIANAKKIAEFFNVKPALLRPDIFGA